MTAELTSEQRIMAAAIIMRDAIEEIDARQHETAEAA